MSDEVIQLPNIPAEYHYIQRLACEKCGQSVEGNRLGSSPSPDGRMHDTWDVTCTGCGATKRIVLSVPPMDIFKMLGLNKPQ
ncbi:MAG: hypothetical protein BWX88_02794 [Planctomycetes bacterium ADurb.Bin126]|nr:MAG: hypothetical protein BWX88_02794 [Planctomycetes bacterium ADurb.Bin126]HOD79922.1 hypothetical protein [Phycisphaerae bacterium]HQL73263.1 hypothetical protein [Phycisphaerae bacterium]